MKVTILAVGLLILNSALAGRSSRTSFRDKESSATALFDEKGDSKHAMRITLYQQACTSLFDDIPASIRAQIRMACTEHEIGYQNGGNGIEENLPASEPDPIGSGR